MDYEFRIVVEKVSVASQKVVKRDTLKIYDLNTPQSILDLGLRHEEQISLLSKVQSALLAEQTILIDLGHDRCPQCGAKISKNGFMPSKFHAVFSDHKLRIQKHRCKNPECNWESAPTTTSVFGTHIHPDLAKLQCEQGALHSYREAVSNLEKLNTQRRTINNHDRVKHLTNQVGERLSQANHKAPSQQDLPVPAPALIVQVDGGHIPTKEQNKRSFEALSGIIYQPNCIECVDQHHRRITHKSCVISALDDDLKTFQTYLYNAALKQGLCEATVVTALADGASNGWSSISVLAPHCKMLDTVLDWFHIGKKFQTVKNALGEVLSASLEKAKWSLWHGDAEKSAPKNCLDSRQYYR